jgi:hypothetical protein
VYSLVAGWQLQVRAIIDSYDSDDDGVGDGADVDDDDDGQPDASDGCPTRVTTWVTAATDRDCDGYSFASESFVGTDAGDACADTTTPNDERGAAFGEPEPPWVPDVNDNGIVQINDVLAVGAALNTSPPNPNYKARFDWNGNGIVTIADLLQVGPFLNKSCTP